MVDRVQAKMAAKNCMRTAQVSPYKIGAVFFLITFVLGSADALFSELFSTPVYLDGYTYMQPHPISVFITILVSLISIVLQAGFFSYCLGVRRGHEMPLSSLFDGFSIVGKVVLLQIVMGLFVTLWSMLFLIPGIIAAYRYYFALINLLENPDLGIMECIRLSKEQTRGYKWQLFVLDLSFLGWAILSIFTMGILYIWLAPYMMLTQIAFYDTICASKGISVNGGNPHWADAAQSTSADQYDYDWNQQNQSWDSAHKNEPSQEPSQKDKTRDPWDLDKN